MDSVRIGVIGVGNIARNYHLPPVHALPNAELIAVADLDESLRAKAQDQFGFRDSYDDYRHILDRDDIHAIMLLTRVSTHTEIIPAALEAVPGLVSYIILFVPGDGDDAIAASDWTS